jgi:hypothetical protein
VSADRGGGLYSRRARAPGRYRVAGRAGGAGLGRAAPRRPDRPPARPSTSHGLSAMGDAGADASSSPPPPPSGSFSYFAVFRNYPLVAALLGFAVAQSIKFFVTRYAPRPSPSGMFGSGDRARPWSDWIGSDPHAVSAVKAASWHCSTVPYSGRPKRP